MLLFVYATNDVRAYFLVYVDEVILIGNHSHFLNSVISKLGMKFSIRDLGPLCYVLGVEVRRSNTWLSLLQHQYIHTLFSNTNMLNCIPIRHTY